VKRDGARAVPFHAAGLRGRARRAAALTGTTDATADRKAALLGIDAAHQDIPVGKTTSAAVREEIRDLARWLELDVKLPA
jgi:uncharacterized protein